MHELHEQYQSCKSHTHQPNYTRKQKGYVLFFCYNTYTKGEQRNLFGENSEKCAHHIAMKEYDQLNLLSFSCSPFSIMLTDQSCPLLCSPKLLKRHYYLHLLVSQLLFNTLYMWRPWLVVFAIRTVLCTARPRPEQHQVWWNYHKEFGED